jgi:hypothetical protein
MCLQTISHCLDMGGKHASREHQTILADCAAICDLSHGFLLRDSQLHMHTCRACADICRACADDCMRIGPSDHHMRACAEMCRRCAESCEHMASAGV